VPRDAHSRLQSGYISLARPFQKASGGAAFADDKRHCNSPLQVLLLVMRSSPRDGRLKEAADIAKAAALYLHMIASASAHRATIATMRDEELAELRRSLMAGRGISAQF